MSKARMRMLLKHLEEFIQNWQQVLRGRLRHVTGILITKKNFPASVDSVAQVTRGRQGWSTRMQIKTTQLNGRNESTDGPILTARSQPASLKKHAAEQFTRRIFPLK